MKPAICLLEVNHNPTCHFTAMKQDYDLKQHLSQLHPSQMSEGELDAACALRMGLIVRLNTLLDRAEIRAGASWQAFSPTRDMADYGMVVART